MKKQLLCALAFAGVATGLVACGGAETNKLGVGHSISFGYVKEGTANTTIINQINIVAVAATFDKNDKVLSTYIDEIQIPIIFTAASGEGDAAIPAKWELNKTKTQTKDAGDKVVESKKELTTRYNMIVDSPIKKEWHEQAAALEDYVQGKKIADLKSAEGILGDLTQSCTMHIDSYIDALKVAAAAPKKSFTGTAKAGVGIIAAAPTISYGKDLVELNFAAGAYDGDTLKAAALDVYQVPLTKEGTLNATATQTKDAGDEIVETKRDLQERYAMIPASDIKKEWFEQAAALEDYFAGKKVSQIVAGDATMNALKSSCTMAIDELVASIVEAKTNSK